MQTSRSFFLSSSSDSRRDDIARDDEPKQPSAATPTAAGAPQPIDAELLEFVGGAGMGIAPVNRW